MTINEVVATQIRIWMSARGKPMTQEESDSLAEDILEALPARAQYSVSYEHGTVVHAIGSEKHCRMLAAGHEDSHVYRRVVLETSWKELPL